MAFKNEEFEQAFYFAHGGTGSGASAADAWPMTDRDLMSIEAGMVVTNVSVVITTAVTGTTQIDIGDDDDADGFVSAAALTASAVTASDGAYLAAGLEKYYGAAGKEVKADFTTASSAGALVVMVRGYKV